MVKKIGIKTTKIHLYYIFGIILVGLYFLYLLLIFWLSQNVKMPVPDFLHPVLVKHDWLTILYFPLLAILLAIIPFWLINHFINVGRRLFENDCIFTFEKDKIIIFHQDNYRIELDNFDSAKCYEKISYFPIKSRFNSPYTYLKIVLKNKNNAYIINSQIIINGNIFANIMLLLNQLEVYYGDIKIEKHELIKKLLRRNK
jgi:hypothetical protein